MAANKVLHMNSGDGKTSYDKNSGFQKAGMSKSMHVLEETLKDMFNHEHIDHDLPKCFTIVDLGCSSGPNAFWAMSHIMDTIRDLFEHKNIINELPEFEVFLNDLPDNDFNNLFKSLPEQTRKERGHYFVYGLPGSFYDRLLPRNSVNFVYASASVHWLSRVPEGIENKNKENIYMAMTSPSDVYEIYANQYKRDFRKLLSLRAAEIMPGGRMVLIFIARSVEDPSTKDDFPIFTILAKTLAEMAAEGIIKMDDLYSFNVPIYAPCIQEVETAIQSEGSFTLDKWDSYHLYGRDTVAPTDDQANPLVLDKNIAGKRVAESMRATCEPLLASHFGISITDDVFVRYANNFAEHLSAADAGSFQIVISLTRK